MNLAITGHRPKDLPTGSKSWVVEQLIKVYNEVQPELIYIGMAEGVDIVAAETAISEGFAIHCAIPYDGHWPRSGEKASRYNKVLERAKEVTIVCPGPYGIWKLHKRNEFMVDNAESLVSVWTGKESGGTYSCIKYALKSNKSWYNINPLKMEVIDFGSTLVQV